MEYYTWNQISPLSRDEYFYYKHLFQLRGVFPHEIFLARLVATCDAFYGELVQVGVIDGPSLEELGPEQSEENFIPNSYCSICAEQQFSTNGGVNCKYGHGATRSLHRPDDPIEEP